MLDFVCHILVFNLNRKFKETAAYFYFFLRPVSFPVHISLLLKELSF